MDNEIRIKLSWESLIRSWSEWHAATFPPRRVSGEKLQEEVRELCDLLPMPIGVWTGNRCAKDNDHAHFGTDKLAEEGADVLMVLIRTLELNGVSPERLLAECWRKLEVNRGRKWTVVNGVERHIEE